MSSSCWPCVECFLRFEVVEKEGNDGYIMHLRSYVC